MKAQTINKFLIVPITVDLLLSTSQLISSLQTSSSEIWIIFFCTISITAIIGDRSPTGISSYYYVSTKVSTGSSFHSPPIIHGSIKN